MNEKKQRFFIYKDMVSDTDMKIPITLWQNKEQQKKFCDELNKLNDENEQLEKSIEQLRTIIDDNIDFNSLFTNRELSDICNETGWELSEKSIKLQQLEKENEQLKKELDEVIDTNKLGYEVAKILKNEIEQLKAQLKKGEDVCSICKHQYLTKRDADEYYIAKCKKEHIECSRGTVNYCEDFKCKDETE